MFFLIRWFFKLVFGLIFLTFFGIAVFTGTLLWKDEQLTLGNFLSDYIDNVVTASGKIIDEVKFRAEQLQESPPSEEEEAQAEGPSLKEVIEVELKEKGASSSSSK